jgi:hypothetical protein
MQLLLRVVMGNSGHSMVTVEVGVVALYVFWQLP